MKKLKKYLFIACLATLGITILMLMAALIVSWVSEYSLFNYEIYVRILVSSAILCADCFFNNTALSVYKRTKILSLAAICLLNLATLLALIVFLGFKSLDNVPGWYGRTVGVLAVSAAFFTMIIGTNGKLGDHVKGLKYTYFSLMIIIDLIIIGCIIGPKFNIFKLVKGIVFPFVLICIAAFALMCVTTIMGRHFKDEMLDDAFVNNDEVLELKNKIDLLTKENANLKEENELLKAKLQELQKQE